MNLPSRFTHLSDLLIALRIIEELIGSMIRANGGDPIEHEPERTVIAEALELRKHYAELLE